MTALLTLARAWLVIVTTFRRLLDQGRPIRKVWDASGLDRAWSPIFINAAPVHPAREEI